MSRISHSLNTRENVSTRERRVNGTKHFRESEMLPAIFADTVKWRQVGGMVAKRRTIQHTYIKLLDESEWKRGDPEPYGIQRKVMESVNKQFYGPTRMKTTPQQVSNWVRRVRDNGYQVTNCEQNYERSRKNSQVFYEGEKKRVVDFVLEGNNCRDIASVWKDKRGDKGGKQRQVSESSARRFVKASLDEGSHVAAKPKGMRVSGQTAHHSKARFVEAEYWKNQPQDVIDGIVFGDESKMLMKMGSNKTIDIKWCFRGNASDKKWHEDSRHTTQINLFLVQSINGIMVHMFFDRNMTKEQYVKKLPQIKEAIDDEDDLDFTVFMHDNAWRGDPPIDELDDTFGEDRYTKYMGDPCKTIHKEIRIPGTDQPCMVPKKRCNCEFPDGPIHASYTEESPCSLFIQLMH